MISFNEEGRVKKSPNWIDDVIVLKLLGKCIKCNDNKIFEILTHLKTVLYFFL